MSRSVVIEVGFPANPAARFAVGYALNLAKTHRLPVRFECDGKTRCVWGSDTMSRALRREFPELFR